MTPWPEPIPIRQVLFEAGLVRFLGEILSEQSPTAPVGAVTLRPRYRSQGRRARALVYVGPLEADTPERIRDLMRPTYIAGHAWDPVKLLKFATATAQDPGEYASGS